MPATMNPLKDPEDLEEATETINQYAKSDWCRLSYSVHGEERKDERIVPADVVQMTLANGVCVEWRSEIKGSQLRYSYTMEYRDSYGRVTVVTAIPGFHRLHIVTTHTDQS